MPRELRPRKPLPSYADLAGGIEDNQNVAGPSKVHPVDGEDDSESVLEPDKGPGGSKKVPSSDEDEDIAMDDAQAPESEVEETPKQSRKTASSRKPRAPVTSTTAPGSPTVLASLKTRKEQSRRLPPRVQQATRTPSASTPPVAAPRAAKTYALPNPSAHHRHRAIPVFFREEMVERLDEPPLLFKEPRIVPTNSMTADHSLTNRVSKSWGFNVGAGPVWQIMEDRSCYKESIGSSTGSEKESSRRPRVYQNVSVRPGWEVLSNQCVTYSWLPNLYSSYS
jgi:transcription factor C subunit 6